MLKKLPPYHWIVVGLLLILSSLLAQPARAQPINGSWLELPYGFVEEFVVTGVKLPTSFAITPDNRIFIAEKAGVVRVWHEGELLPDPFVDMRFEVNDAGDRGMMGITVHPQFPAQPYIYVTYVYDPPEARGIEPKGARVSRLMRLTADPNNLNRVLPGSGVVLLGKNSTFENIGNPGIPESRPFTCEDDAGTPVQDCFPMEGTAHVLGGMVFGRDGALYVGSGDGINSIFGNLRAQNIDSVAGKILRIDPLTGNGYTSNPFFDGDPTSNRSKVYLLGMRNPFRFNIHPSTGEVYVGEVGNNNWEEINIGRAGANFGWPCFEGPDQITDNPICEPLFSGRVQHVIGHYTYPHENNQGSVIGGDFYRGRTFPPQYHGRFFFGDFNEGSIMYLDPPVAGVPVHHRLTTNLPGPVQIISPADGNLYILLIGPGKLMRIRYDPTEYTSRVAGNPHSNSTFLPASPPSYIPAVAPQSAPTPILVATASTAAQTAEETVQTAPAQAAPARQVTQQVAAPSSAPVMTDAITRVDVQPATRRDANSPIYVNILRPNQALRYKIGDTVNYAGFARDADGRELTGENLQWTVFMHHNEHTHYDFHEGSGRSGSFEYADHGDRTYLELCLTATDGDESNTDCINVQAQEVTYVFDSRPSGQPMIYNAGRYITPFRVVTYVNAERQISAPREPQPGITFQSWSNQRSTGNSAASSSDASQMIKIGAASQTLAAYYSIPTAVPAVQASAVQPTAVQSQVVQQSIAQQPATASTEAGVNSSDPAASAPPRVLAVQIIPQDQPTAASAGGAVPFPAGAVSLVLPDQNGGGTGRTLFRWSTAVVPPPGQAFEVIVWKKGQDAMAEGLGIAAPTRGSEVTVDLNTLDQSLGNLFDAGTYNWTVSLVTVLPYERLQIVGDTRQFTYTR